MLILYAALCIVVLLSYFSTIFMQSIQLQDGRAKVMIDGKECFIFPEIDKSPPQPNFRYGDYYIDEHPVIKAKNALFDSFRVPILLIPLSIMKTINKQTNVTYIFRVPEEMRILATFVDGAIKFYAY